MNRDALILYHVAFQTICQSSDRTIPEGQAQVHKTIDLSEGIFLSIAYNTQYAKLTPSLETIKLSITNTQRKNLLPS